MDYTVRFNAELFYSARLLSCFCLAWSGGERRADSPFLRVLLHRIAGVIPAAKKTLKKIEKGVDI